MFQKEVRLPFVEREEIVGLVRNQYGSILRPEGDKTAFGFINVYGFGGMGKTYIAENLKEKYNENFVYIDLDHIERLSGLKINIADVLSAIAEETKRFGFKFNMFAIAYEQYFALKNRYKYIKPGIEKRDIPLGDIGGLFVEAISKAAEVTATVEPFMLATKGVTTVGKSFRLPEKIMNLLDPKKKQVLKEMEKCTTTDQAELFLLNYFVQEMNENIKNSSRPLVIYLDTYESYFGGDDGKTKIEGRMKDLIQSLHKVLWIFAGRNKLNWRFDETCFVEVKNIEKQESFETIFEAVNLCNIEHQNYIKDETKGYPEYLREIIEEYNREKDMPGFEIETLTGGLSKAVMRLCGKLDPELQELLRKFCILKCWDCRENSLLKSLLTDFNMSERQYRMLKEQGFVTEDKDVWSVPKCIYEVLLKDIGVLDIEMVYDLCKKHAEDETDANRDFYEEQKGRLLSLMISKDVSVIREHKTEVMERLMVLYDMVESDIEEFEHEFFGLWAGIQNSTCDDVYVTALALYRKYLVLIKDGEGFKKTFIEDSDSKKLAITCLRQNKRVLFEEAATLLEYNSKFAEIVLDRYRPALGELIDVDNKEDIFRYSYLAMLSAFHSGERENLETLIQIYKVYLRDYNVPESLEYFKMSLLALKGVCELRTVHGIEVKNLIDAGNLLREAQTTLGRTHYVTGEIMEYVLAMIPDAVSMKEVEDQFDFYDKLYGDTYLANKWKYWYVQQMIKVSGEKNVFKPYNKKIVQLLLEIDDWSERCLPKTDLQIGVLQYLYIYYYRVKNDKEAAKVKKRFLAYIEGNKYFTLHFEDFVKWEGLLIKARKQGK